MPTQQVTFYYLKAKYSFWEFLKNFCNYLGYLGVFEHLNWEFMPWPWSTLGLIKEVMLHVYFHNITSHSTFIFQPAFCYLILKWYPCFVAGSKCPFYEWWNEVKPWPSLKLRLRSPSTSRMLILSSHKDFCGWCPSPRLPFLLRWQWVAPGFSVTLAPGELTTPESFDNSFVTGLPVAELQYCHD